LKIGFVRFVLVVVLVLEKRNFLNFIKHRFEHEDEHEDEHEYKTNLRTS
jgi:hypothetical protein